MTCITEKAFLECSCERCIRYRESMIRGATLSVISEMIYKSIRKNFHKEESTSISNGI
jgi:hypothetical protein